jgi:hypothetical protein
MSSYDPKEIRKLRDEAQSKSAELQEEIANKRALIIALDERVKVYNEFLKGELSARSERGMEHSSEDSEKKYRAPRSTKAEMAKRKDILIHIFATHGFMQPKEILAEIPSQLGYELEQHHLRAVLKRFPEVFTQDPERHGYWGLLHPPESESDSESIPTA